MNWNLLICIIALPAILWTAWWLFTNAVLLGIALLATAGAAFALYIAFRRCRGFS